MGKKNLWKWIIVLLVVVWSIYQLYPPKGRDIATEFQRRAIRRDVAYSNIVYELRRLQTQNPARAFGNLLDAIGTNDITRYFAFWPEASKQPDPTRYILHRLQREGAGKIRLGLDLQGGVSFLVQMQYEVNPEHLLDTLVHEAKHTDAAFTNIIETVQQIVKQTPDIQIRQLLNILATNDITRYFDAVPSGGETNRARAVVEWVYQRALETSRREAALAQAVEVLRRRVDKFGVAEPIIQPAGSDRILIQLPGLSEADKESAMRQIQRAAFLEFRLVHPESDELVMRNERAPGYEFLPHPHEAVVGGRRVNVPGYLVQKKPAYGMTGKYVKNAFPTRDPYTGGLQIAFNLTSEGAKIFGKLTEANVGRQLAIVLDGVLYSAPVIRTAILGGSGVIEGNFDLAEAQELANVLQNPLEAPVKIIESREVDPSLGKDTIQSGIRAAIIGATAVVLFMLVYYLLAGLIADVALLLNVLIILGVMCYIRATFTLPGIAGIVLTIGMAVDANVLIFERIREELAAGKSLRGAIAAGYSKAFWTILDTNLTTLIASVILIFMGTGPVKGFGTTLTIGVTASMFTALVVTRLIFDFLLDKNLLKSLPMLSLIRGTNIDFLRWAMPAFIASWTLILVGNSYGIFVRGHRVLGPDFAGGIQQTYLFSTPQGGSADTLREDVRRVLAPLGLGEVTPVVQRNLATGVETLRLVLPYREGVSELVANTLREKLPQYKFSPPSVDTVGPVVGKEITRTAIIASLLAMFGILIYVAFRYEFSFAVGAIVALIHDIFMTLGWFFLSGRELSAPIVAAILTIIGFSINDTIVVFDRIREDLKLGVRGTFREVINKALNQCLSRTIITSLTVFLATLSLYLFGGGVINDFAFTFLVGIVTGTYSSIYIASALVLWWHKGERPVLGSQVAVQPVPEPAKA